VLLFCAPSGLNEGVYLNPGLNNLMSGCFRYFRLTVYPLRGSVSAFPNRTINLVEDKRNKFFYLVLPRDPEQ